MPLGKHLARAVELADKPQRRPRGGNDFLHHVDVADFLETLEVENIHKTSSDEYNYSCPFDGHTSGDAKPSAYMNDGSKDRRKTTLWKCQGCGRDGNGITFYALLENISKQQAIQHIRTTWAPNFRAPKGGSISAEFEERVIERWEREHARDIVNTIDWKHYDKLFAVDWTRSAKRYKRRHTDDPAEIYLFVRGFADNTLAEWRIGYDPHKQRLTIPVSNIDGDLLGVKGRVYDDRKPKYLILGDRQNRRPHYGFMPYEKSRVVFGLDKAIVSKAKTGVLHEGELDAMAVAQCGYTGLSTGSAHVSTEQAILLRDHLDELIVMFDTNTAGRNATWGWEDKEGEWHPGLVERLAPFLHVRIVADHRHDAAELLQLGQIQALHDLISEAKSYVHLLT